MQGIPSSPRTAASASGAGSPPGAAPDTTQAPTFQDCSRSNANGTTVSCAHVPPPGRLRTRRGRRELTVSKDRIAGIDLKALPPDPSPPDMWQDQAACHGIDPDTFFPTSEEEAGPALAFCSACDIRQTC